MKIDYAKLEKKHWFEDEHGNEIPEEDVDKVIGEGNRAVFYRHCFPLELHDYIDEYCYHPENPIIKFLCRKSQRFYNWISVGKERTFKTILDGRTSFGGKWAQDCIVAMVNSGDFTLEQAIWRFANSCERCMNSLLYKYLDGKDGYPEYSEEWRKCNTECDFCRERDTE